MLLHSNGFLSARLDCQQQKVERVSSAYGAQTHTRPDTNPSLGALAGFPDFSVSDGSYDLPVFPLMSLSPSHCAHRLRHVETRPGGAGVGGLRVTGLPASARHAAPTGRGFTECSRRRHHCARDQCVQ